MTGYTVHTGSTQKFAQGWDSIFGPGSATAAGGQKAKRAAARPARTPTTAPKKTAKKQKQAAQKR